MPPSLVSRARTAIAKAIAPAHVARPSYPNLAAPRRYPDYNTSRSSILGTEHNMGRSGLKYFYPGWIRNEPLSELQGAAKYLVFKEMGDMNGYCAAALNAFAMFLRRAKWRVDPVLDENKTNGSAQFLEECMEDMEHSWSTFIAQASRTVPQMGFCPFEIVYKLRAGENEDDPRLESKHDDGKIGWQTFAIRSPETVFHWVWYPDDPTRLRGLVQLTPPDYPTDLFIPIEKILLLRAEPGEDNPEGRSILRSSYKPFIIIRWMEDARNTIIEHSGTGTLKAELPPSITNPYVLDPVTGNPVLEKDGVTPKVDPIALQTLNTVRESLKNIRLCEEPYIIIPAQYDENGHKLFDISYLTNNGGSMIGEINNTIKEEGMKILMSCMAEFLALGTNATGGGSFALSRDKTDNFSLAITSLLDLFQESINNQAVKRLFKLNPEFDLEVLPRIVHDPIVPININEVAAVLSGFKGIGWDLTKEANSEEIKNAILEAVGLPKAAKKDEANDGGAAKPEAKPGEGKPPEELKIPPVPETKAVKPEPLTEPGKVGKKAPFAKWDESEHPREDDGKFTDGSGSASSTNAKTSSAPTITSNDIGDVLDSIRSRTSDEYFNLNAIYDADEADQKYFIDTTNDILSRVHSEMSGRGVEFNEKYLKQQILGSNHLMNGEPDKLWPIPVYVKAKGASEGESIGLLLSKDGKFEMFEGNEDAGEETLDLVNDLMGVGDKLVTVYASHTPDIIERLKAGDFPEGIFVSPSKEYASGYFAEDRDLVKVKIPLNRLKQNSDLDWQIRPAKRLE